MKTLLFPSIAQIPSEQWRSLQPRDFPFWDHAFLRALEESGSVGDGSGWTPRYLTLWEGELLLAAVPLFEKNHSYGEYIFDWAWAEAYQRHGLAYYPKLSAAVPFTPANGPKLLCREGGDREALRDRLIEAALGLLEEGDSSGLHFLFVPERELESYRSRGFLIRHSHQYHWHNRGYRDFGDFLSALKRKRRQQIVSERAKVRQLPLQIHCLSGPTITDDALRSMGRFYRETCERKQAIPYLRPAFFTEMGPELRERCLLILAEEKGQWVAGALFFHRGQKLYGRYWGALREYPFLHFEICYYRPIEWAIEHHIQTFEAGAQGEHKILRGFLPTTTYSAHWIRHEGFRRAIGDFIEGERREVERLIRGLGELDPYRGEGN